MIKFSKIFLRGAKPFQSQWRSGLTTIVVVGGFLFLDTAAVEAKRPTVITDIVTSRKEDGATLVQVTGNGRFQAEEYRIFHISQAPPREVLRLKGVTIDSLANEIAIGDAHVIRIRIGSSPERDPPEVNLVFELASQAVRITDVSIDGDQLLVSLAGGDGPMARVSTATPAPQLIKPTATPTPLPAPTATPTLAPTPVPTAIPAAPLTAVPASIPVTTKVSREERKAASRRKKSQDHRRGSHAEAAPQPKQPMIVYQAQKPLNEELGGQRSKTGSAQISTLTEIVTSQRHDGTTLVRVTIDAEIGKRRIRHRREPFDAELYVFLVQGVRVSGTTQSMDLDIPNLSGLDLSEGQENGLPELKITLRLSSEQVSIGAIAIQGHHLVIVLAPPSAP